jgi:imidazole glycerol phosphate synthase subunit HisF
MVLELGRIIRENDLNFQNLTWDWVRRYMRGACGEILLMAIERDGRIREQCSGRC